MVPNRCTFIEALARDTELQLLSSLKQVGTEFIPDKLAEELARIEQFAQLAPFLFERDDLFQCKCPDDQERELTLVSVEIVDSITCYIH